MASGSDFKSGKCVDILAHPCAEHSLKTLWTVSNAM